MAVQGEAATGFAEVNGARLYYEVAGSGPPLALVHAGVADSRMWDEQFAVFAQHYRVVRYDVRGFGRSVMPPGPFSHADDLAALLQYLDIARAAVIGVSMGGGIAIDCTLKYPELVVALIPVAAGISGRTPSDALRQLWADVDAAAERGDLDEANELELRMWVDGVGRRPDQVDPAVRERVRVMNAAVFAVAEDYALGQSQQLTPPAVGRLAEISVPTLVIVGARDLPDVLTSADLLVAGIAGARKVVLPEVAHMLTMEQPTLFNQLVLDFLAAL